MKLKKTLSGLLIYLFFPIGIVLLGFNREYILLLILIGIYFSVFYILRKESIFRIFAGYYDKSKKYDKALKSLYRAYKLKKSSIDTANTFIYMLLKSGKYKKAGEIIEQVESREMENGDQEILLSNKALYLWKKNSISQSIELYEQLMEKHKSTAVYSAYGYVITLGDDIQKAVKINEDAYDYNKDNKGIMDNLALAYMKAGQLEKSYDLYTNLIKKNPAFPEAYYNFALLHQLQGNLTDSRYYISKALTFSFNGLSTVSKEEVEKKLVYIKRLQGNTL